MKKNFLNKREQSQARLSYAECEKSRLKARLFSLLVLLMTAVSGAWAQTTHVVTQATVDQIFKGDGYTLGDAVKAGDVLDFQGTIDIEHSLIVNKQVTIKSTTKDAVVKLNTPTNVMSSAYTATVMYPQSFVINKAGSGTTVQDIRIENTETWIFNTSNVTFTGVTMWVEDAKVGAGLGHVALRYSDHITFDGCTVYTKNNGGSGCCVLTGSHDCTFKDTRFEAAGSAGNILYIGNPYNGDDKPADYTMNNDNISVLNCTITAESSGGLSQFRIMDGLRHRIENCTVNFATNFSYAATASEDGIVIRNNTFTKGLSIPKASTVTGNTINGNVTIIANNATVSGTTVFPGSTITGNNILGKVTFNSNSKNNTFTGNTVISSDAYAVVMATTKDANNTVTDNVLLAASNAGDAAVNLNNGTGNTVSDNLAKAYDYELTIANNEHGSIKFMRGEKSVTMANEDDVITMTVTPDEGYVVGSVSANAYTTWAGARRKAPAAIPMLGNVTLTPVEGKANTWTFTMPAASVLVSAAYIPVAAFAPAEPSGTLAPTAAEGVIAGEDKAIIVAGTVANIPETTNPQGTVKYFVTDNKDMTAEQAAKANGWVETLPTAAGYTGSYADDFQVYVWYYIQAATGYADSKPQRIEVTVQSNLFDLALNPANANTIEAGKASKGTVSVKVGTGAAVDKTSAITDEGKLEAIKMGSEVKLNAKQGYKFRKVEVKKKAEAKPLANATTEDLGKVVGADGNIYANKAAAEAANTTAVAMICYVNEGHGLALALSDISSYGNSWDNTRPSNGGKTAAELCSAWNTSKAVTGATWKLASLSEMNLMINAAGGYAALRDGFSAVGGTNMIDDYYWVSDESSADYAKNYNFGGGYDMQEFKDNSYQVRACLEW